MNYPSEANGTEEMLLPHYAAERLAGKTVSRWFTECPYAEVERNQIAWGIMHICFAFWHDFADPSLEQNDIERLIVMCEKFSPGILQYLTPTFIVYYYHFVVGKYGHLPRSSGFCDYVEDKAKEYLYEDENITFQFPLNHNPAHEMRRPIVLHQTLE